MHAPLTAGATPAASEPKRRTITLTNRAPIRIVEDQWPVIAEGLNSSGGADECPWGWKADVRVRHETKSDKERHPALGRRYLIHAKYSEWDETEDEYFDVRVGRIISGDDAARKLWEHILAVGNELRERIDAKYHVRVTHAVDRCFAKLSPHNE